MLRPHCLALLVLTSLPQSSLAQGSVTLEFEIHPKLAAEDCPQLPRPSDIPKAEDFPRLLSAGWVTLKHHSFEASREFWPCLQVVEVEFPARDSYVEFARRMRAGPQYPFWSGADHEMQTAIFERTVERGEKELYQVLLAKDGRCVSELNAPLYSILRGNPTAFLEVWGQLEASAQEIAVQTQYDFNVPLDQQQFPAEVVRDLPTALRPVAAKYNKLMQTASR